MQGVKIAVYVGYDHSEAPWIELAAHELAEVVHLGKVGKLHVYRVVEMAEYVEVVEAGLAVDAVVESHLCCGHFLVGAGRKDYFGCQMIFFDVGFQ